MEPKTEVLEGEVPQDELCLKWKEMPGLTGLVTCHKVQGHDDESFGLTFRRHYDMNKGVKWDHDHTTHGPK